ncbi:S-adenosyl-L-methionine-dependent methyltransferase [Eremomyces bilateralis CBS 781.70]|uniref:S-adenosyl-L-methionine-dependent methyltransferase n=1 Tax=Eremomyces bilateralis CBS 781.70 TaxID=1392243 RepID=A0A6G1FQQ3_9PEZI|nr:S-adenosyl-L-methionine-dependent methyltransferase [Eremomyces bilateralis CBS 781.70]KAF1808019.1 S-adenosyl-L-methionine-dependent methyltransferase [Eremomyces bilateralis CBS 781.70]
MAESRFDKEAAEWDTNPTVKEASERALEAILKYCPQLQDDRRELSAIEFGCGTGLLSLPFSRHVESLVAVDLSHGMVEALKLKLSVANPEASSNIRPVCALITDPDDPALQDDSNGGAPKRFDLLISNLLLHHIPELQPFLKTMFGVLAPGGVAIFLDFENFGPAARKFHPESKMEGVERHGIVKEEIEELMRAAGFSNVRVERPHTLKKPIDEGAGTGEFPFLACLGGKAI